MLYSDSFQNTVIKKCACKTQGSRFREIVKYSDINRSPENTDHNKFSSSSTVVTFPYFVIFVNGDVVKAQT